MNRPILIVVTGRPGSGKTTLAHSLAKVIRCPAICRDEFKEGYLNTLGVTGTVDPNATSHVFEAYFETLAVMLKNRITLVAEAAFQHHVWGPRLEPLAEIADIRIVVCHVPSELAYARRQQRDQVDPGRAAFHPYPPDYAGAAETYDPPHLNFPTLTVDTTDGYAPGLREILTFARHG